MPKVNFTSALRRFYPDLEPFEVKAEKVSDILEHLNQRYPGLTDYLVDEQGRLRQHVNIFIGERLIKDKIKLQDKLSDQDEVFIMQALSGG